MTLSDGILGAIAAAILGWFANSITKVSKSDFKDLVGRVARLEQDHITRRDIERLEDFMSQFRDEIKADLRQLITKG
jgi:hypothetical protein